MHDESFHLDPALSEASRRVGHDARELGESLLHLKQLTSDTLRMQMEVRPYATLAAAAGVGYVLGGGLATRLTGWALHIGGRMLLNHALSTLTPEPPVAEPPH